MVPRVGSAVILLVLAWTQSSNAQLAIENRRISFDSIYSGQKVQGVFYFQNAGDVPLVIERVRTSCGCSTASWPRDTIRPGVRDSLVLAFNSDGKIGNQVKKAWITLKGNAAELSPVTLKGYVRESLLKQYLNTYTIDLAHATDGTVEVMNYGSHPVMIDSIATECPLLKVSVSQNAVAPKDTVVLRVARLDRAEAADATPDSCDTLSTITVGFKDYLGITASETEIEVRLSTD